jgi:hypothetical protein
MRLSDGSGVPDFMRGRRRRPVGKKRKREKFRIGSKEGHGQQEQEYRDKPCCGEVNWSEQREVGNKAEWRAMED